jgi:hypothetical protein
MLATNVNKMANGVIISTKSKFLITYFAQVQPIILLKRFMFSHLQNVNFL